MAAGLGNKIVIGQMLNRQSNKKHSVDTRKQQKQAFRDTQVRKVKQKILRDLHEHVYTMTMLR